MTIRNCPVLCCMTRAEMVLIPGTSLFHHCSDDHIMDCWASCSRISIYISYIYIILYYIILSYFIILYFIILYHIISYYIILHIYYIIYMLCNICYVIYSNHVIPTQIEKWITRILEGCLPFYFFLRLLYHLYPLITLRFQCNLIYIILWHLLYIYLQCFIVANSYQLVQDFFHSISTFIPYAWYFMIFHDISWYFMIFHEISWYIYIVYIYCIYNIYIVYIYISSLILWFNII